MRNNKLVIYGSSYDRGCEHLLKIWPDVKKEVPEAQLRIFYGWDLFERMFKDNPASMAWKEKMEGMMKYEGITHLGRISHEACIKEHENAGIWAYPTHFGEISCITAMRAQVYGSIPVVVDYAALEETVQHGVKVKGDIYDSEVREEYKKQLISLLKDNKRQEEIRGPMMKWAKEKFSWANVATQWDEEFNTISLRGEVEALMEDNQALKAWGLVKDTKDPIKDSVWEKVKHAFNEDEYTKFYSQDLTENPFPEELVLDCTKLYPRFAYVVPKIESFSPKKVIDLGCADGALCLTLAKDGIECVGINLYKPSVDLANMRANKNRLKASFYCNDIFNVAGKYDVAVMMEVLEHLPDPQKGVDHTMELLEEGGHAFFSTPGINHLGIKQHKEEVGHANWDDGKPSGHLRIFTEEEFKNLFKNYKIVDFHTDEEGCMIAEVIKNV